MRSRFGLMKDSGWNWCHHRWTFLGWFEVRGSQTNRNSHPLKMTSKKNNFLVPIVFLLLNSRCPYMTPRQLEELETYARGGFSTADAKPGFTAKPPADNVSRGEFVHLMDKSGQCLSSERTEVRYRGMSGGKCPHARISSDPCPEKFERMAPGRIQGSRSSVFGRGRSVRGASLSRSGR